jgi:exonuclease V gamma subunit
LSSGSPECGDVARPIGKRVKLVGKPDHDVSDAAFAANSALYSVEAENGDRARTDEDEDPIR